MHCLIPRNRVPIRLRVKPWGVRDQVVVVNHTGTATRPNHSLHARGIIFYGLEQIQRPLNCRLEELEIAIHVGLREWGCRMIDGVKRGCSLYRRVVCSRGDNIADNSDGYLRLLRGKVL